MKNTCTPVSDAVYTTRPAGSPSQNGIKGSIQCGTFANNDRCIRVLATEISAKISVANAGYVSVDSINEYESLNPEETFGKDYVVTDSQLGHYCPIGLLTAKWTETE